MNQLLLVNATWLRLIRDLLERGEEVRPRDRTTKEILGYQTQVYMKEPLMTVAARKLGYRFAVAEPAWIASGDNRVETIAPFSKKIPQFSDDGYAYFGAYGPKFVEQLSYVVNTLLNDPMSRQAVMTFWRERPGVTKDVPCTVALQWFIRSGRLHCQATMRSSDAWLGWPYDVHTFSVLSMMVLILLRNRIQERKPCDRATYDIPELGTLTLTAGSQHLYASDWKDALAVLTDPIPTAFEYEPIDLDTFPTPTDLVEHYWDLARGNATSFGWLKEIYHAPAK